MHDSVFDLLRKCSAINPPRHVQHHLGVDPQQHGSQGIRRYEEISVKGGVTETFDEEQCQPEILRRVPNMKRDQLSCYVLL